MGYLTKILGPQLEAALRFYGNPGSSDFQMQYSAKTSAMQGATGGGPTTADFLGIKQDQTSNPIAALLAQNALGGQSPEAQLIV